MKSCEICGSKLNGQLAIQLMTGPNGYRRYQACPKCREMATRHEPRPAGAIPTRPIPTLPQHGDNYQ